MMAYIYINTTWASMMAYISVYIYVHIHIIWASMMASACFQQAFLTVNVMWVVRTICCCCQPISSPRPLPLSVGVIASAGEQRITCKEC